MRVDNIHSSFYRYYFAKKFNHIIGVEAARRAAIKVEQQLATASARSSSGAEGGWSRRIFRWRTHLSTVPEDSASDDAGTRPKENARKLRPDMIRRMDAPPKPVNPSGWITESGAVPMKRFSLKSGATSSDIQAEEQVFVDETEQVELGTDVRVKNIHVETDNAGSSDLERRTS